MRHLKRVLAVSFLGVMLFYAKPAALTAEVQKADEEKIVQAEVVLTVSEGKRLIARGIAQMPIVKKALKDGMVIVCKGTTTTYVAEELSGMKIAHGAYVLGKTYPEKSGKRMRDADRIERCQRRTSSVPTYAWVAVPVPLYVLPARSTRQSIVPTRSKRFPTSSIAGSIPVHLSTFHFPRQCRISRSLTGKTASVSVLADAVRVPLSVRQAPSTTI